MRQQIKFGVLHLFCGIGGGALGFQQSRGEYRGVKARFHTIAGIDCDPEACEDFENLTGARTIQMDLFNKADYVAYHGKQPPPGWKEVTPLDLRQSVRETPEMIFMSPPCKGFSSLLPQKTAKSEKYEALNRLVTRGMFLALEAWKDNLPGLILLENVPRITARGKDLLHTLKGLLNSYGYAIHEGFHDCGELGGLAQRRRRYLLIARQPHKIPYFVYKPPLQRLKTIGDVIGTLPFPDDIKAGGPMHRLPRLQWKTWVRLALIPPGGDWRDLQITNNVYRVIPWEISSKTITGGRVPSQEGFSIADTRLNHSPRKGVLKGAQWNKPSGAVIGSASVRGSNGVAAISDPRIGHYPRDGAYQIGDWSKASGPVVGSARVNSSNGIAAVADPRLDNVNGYGNKYRVVAWDRECGCVTGSRFGSGAPAISDIRLGCRPRYGVMDWELPSKTITGAADIHAGTAAIADIRIPVDTDRPDPPPVIVAPDGSWHRPLTTYELAMIQGFPSHMPDGRPLQLAGKSDARWRERIGNAVPPPSAMAVGNPCLQALLLSKLGAWELCASDIWVVPMDTRKEFIDDQIVAKGADNY